VYHYLVHEFSLAEEIFRIVIATAVEHELQSVDAVKLDVGRLAGVSTEALEYAWNFLRASDGRTTQATLAITHIGGAGQCRACGFAGAVAEPLPICPACGAPGLRFTAGAEFMLTQISGEPRNTSASPV
jgi:hydrogenase nickel incorporation protein HypA/HybF